MDRDLNDLYQIAMNLLMEKEAIKYRNFFSQDEFEKNMGKIFIMTGARRNLEKKLKNNEKNI
jgi:hypothetical protein